MKKRRFITLVLFITFILGIFLFPYPKKIDKTLAANVYDGTKVVQKTTIKLSGEQTKRLISSELVYIGSFEIEYYERSCRPGTEAKIKWLDEENQYITFFQNGNSSFLDIKKIIINEKMTEIAVVFSDGTVVATSENILAKIKNGLTD